MGGTSTKEMWYRVLGDRHTILVSTEHNDLGLNRHTEPLEFINTFPSLSPGTEEQSSCMSPTIEVPDTAIKQVSEERGMPV